MIIAAVSDLDRQDDLKAFEKAIKGKKPDLILLAGDMAFMMDPDQPERYKEVLKIFRKNGWNAPIVAVFGNHEQGEDDELKIVEECGNDMLFLRDKAIGIKIGKKEVGIVGSMGILDAKTMVDLGGVIGMVDSYGERIEKLNRMIKGLKGDVKILLTHYSPGYKTLKGEPEELWEVMGSEVLEEMVKKSKLDFCVHGHAHSGIPLAFIGKKPVFNVVFEINNNQITMIDTEKLPKE